MTHTSHQSFCLGRRVAQFLNQKCNGELPQSDSENPNNLSADFTRLRGRGLVWVVRSSPVPGVPGAALFPFLHIITCFVRASLSPGEWRGRRAQEGKPDFSTDLCPSPDPGQTWNLIKSGLLAPCKRDSAHRTAGVHQEGKS